MIFAVKAEMSDAAPPPSLMCRTDVIV